MSAQQQLEGILGKIVYAQEDSGWAVARLRLKGQGQVTVVGNLMGTQPGESLRLDGRWERDRRFGRQFRVSSCTVITPKTLHGIERYLRSGLVKGIGKAMAKRLVRHFGLETLEVIDRDPERLAEVEGIGPVRSRRIRDAWREQRAIRDVMVFLHSHGVPTGHALKIFRRYGDEAVAKVRENPYRLAQEVYGIGFASADKIAHDLGIPPDSPHRAAAGLLHAAGEATSGGHAFLPERELLEAGEVLLGAESSPLEEALARLLADGRLIAVPLPEGGGRAIYTPPLAEAEVGLAAGLLKLLSKGPPSLELHVERAIAWFEKREGLTLATSQRQALTEALRAKVLVLTGGPGTGKTTLLLAVVRILLKKELRILLAAPTGRAAKRLSEATGNPAKTVHRLLEYNPRQRAFERGPERPLDADLVIIDEASMLDTPLAFHVLQAIPARARLLLVGDVDQLPSVGPGRVLADVIESGIVPVARLTEIFRQARESLIVVNAHRIRTGRRPELRAAGNGADFFFIQKRDPEDVVDVLRQLVAKRIPGRFGFDPMADIQVLTPMRRGLLGAANLNAELQALLNPDGKTVSRGGRLLRIGDRVMQVRNNYDLDVFNGDVGRLQGLDLKEQLAHVEVDGRVVTYDFKDLDQLRLAYACSIHKSQGSEYPCVVLPLHTQHFVMLERNLLYTALTRAKRLAVLVGSRRALDKAVSTVQASRRFTLLADRLQSVVSE